MNTKNANVITPSDDPLQPENVMIANLFLMAFSLLAYGIAFVAGIKLIYEYMIVPDYPHPDGALFAQVVALALLFLLGWGASLISVRVLKNPIYPFILRILGFFVSFGMAGIYGLGIFKTYNERALGLHKYVLVLLAGYLVLVAFYLLTEKADLRMMILPLVGSMAIHIFLLVFHYILYGAAQTKFIWVDLGFLVILLVLMKLMSSRQTYVPLQQAIKAMLPEIPRTALPRPRPDL